MFVRALKVSWRYCDLLASVSAVTSRHSDVKPRVVKVPGHSHSEEQLKAEGRAVSNMPAMMAPCILVSAVVTVLFEILSQERKKESKGES